MKNKFAPASLLSILLICTLFSCSKKNVDDNWNWSCNSALSFNVDDVFLNCPSSTVFLTTFSNSYYIHSINGNQDIEINFSKNIAAGEVYHLYGMFDVSGTMNQLTIKNITTGIVHASWYAPTGRIKILENDETHIKGMFYCDFRGDNNKSTYKGTVTEGCFNVKKQ